MILQLLLGVVAAVQVPGQESVAAQARDSTQHQLPRAIRVLGVENDMGRSDRYYTNGISVGSWSDARDDAQPTDVALPRPRRWLASLNAALHSLGEVKPLGFRSGAQWLHLIYTPQVIDTPSPDPTDRPFGGLLAYRMSEQSVRRYRWYLSSLSTTELNLGVTGPLAFAGDVQTGWHQLIAAKTVPRGWGQQLPFEPYVGVGYRFEPALALCFGETRCGPGYLRAEISAPLRAQVGTVFRDAEAGVAVRAGFNTPMIVAPRLGPVLMSVRCANAKARCQSLAPIARSVGSNLVAFALAGVSRTGRSRNYFLQGPELSEGLLQRFRADVPIRMLPYLTDVEAGGGLGWGRIVLIVRRVLRTAEFVGGESQSYWSATLTVPLGSHRTP